jgi:hypothetical protein
MRIVPFLSQRPLLVCAIGVICLCIVMYVLGTTMSLWDLSIQLNPINAPLLEGFSLPAASVSILPVTVAWSMADFLSRLHPILREQVPFRPPNRLA